MIYCKTIGVCTFYICLIGRAKIKIEKYPVSKIMLLTFSMITHIKEYPDFKIINFISIIS